GDYLIHYKGQRYFLANGRTGEGNGIFQYATGIKESGAAEGTWRDAEDGWLGKNPIAQGSVDSVVSFRQTAQAGATALFRYWLAVAEGFWDVKALNDKVLDKQPDENAPGKVVERLLHAAMIEQTERHWQSWIARAPGVNGALSETVEEMYRR